MTAELSYLPSGRGDRFDPPASPAWSAGMHVGWTFSGLAQFHGRVSWFFAEGAARGERLMLVVDDPRPRQWPDELLDSGVLTIASIEEVYGSQAIVDGEARRTVLAAALADALDQGYTGLRVAADHTSLAVPGERLEAWLRWEQIADDVMTGNPVIELCGFDRQRIDPDALISIGQRHPHALAS